MTTRKSQSPTSPARIGRKRVEAWATEGKEGSVLLWDEREAAEIWAHGVDRVIHLVERDPDAEAVVKAARKLASEWRKRRRALATPHQQTEYAALVRLRALDGAQDELRSAVERLERRKK